MIRSEDNRTPLQEPVHSWGVRGSPWWTSMMARTHSGRNAILVAGSLLIVGILPWVLFPGVGTDGLVGIASVNEAAPWTDPLDDESHVYLPTSGLVGVEVVGGEVRLRSGFTDGWIATEPISCPADHRYDLVVLEADTPGGSKVLITLLDPTEEPSEVGYANGTIPGYVKRETDQLSIFYLDRATYPSIRIQVNLVAAGPDRPRLLSWSLYFIGLDEWHDDFLGTGKMSRVSGLNITNGALEVNLSRKGGTTTGPIEYDAYPPVFFPGGGSSSSSAVFYSNAQANGYDDASSFTYNGLNHALFADLNGDSELDMVACNGGSYDSEILWGDGSGSWSSAGATKLDTDGANRVAFGDVNGDGGTDLVFACGGATGSCVFLNNGAGNFSYTPDVVFSGKAYPYLDCGDVNNDGYDDIVYTSGSTCDIYYGDANGPDEDIDLTLTRAGGQSSYGVLVADLNGDGYMDVSFGGEVMSKLPIYLGDADGVDATVDQELDVGSYSTRPEVGDLNDDGYLDLVVSAGNGGAYGLWIFEGTASGWSDAHVHKLTYGGGWANHLRVLDVNKDGYDDVLCPVGSDFRLYYGGSSWPTGPSVTKTGAQNSQISIAVPSGFVGQLGGTFITEDIILPQEKKWDLLYLEGTLPKNTSVSISVLDGLDDKVIPNHKALSDMDVDLQGILPSLYPTIKVVVSISTEFNNTTPRLDRLTVKWMDLRTWRDEFHGAAKVERRLNLGVIGGELERSVTTGTAPQIVVTSLRGDEGYSTGSMTYFDGGGLDYAKGPPIEFGTRGASALDVADVDGDGYMDVAFAIRQTGDTTFTAQSPLYLGSPVGWRDVPDHRFPTKGASDVVLRDIDGDGNIDVLFAQETPDGSTGAIDSGLFWGLPGGGWNSTADVRFATNGASGAAVADLDGDGDLDIAFACYGAPSATATDSLVFLQNGTGFCGTLPDHRLPTRGARAVAAGDVNGDGRVDLAFANSFGGGSTEIDSPIYWGKAGGGYETTPKGLRTSGAEDVELADLDGDGDLDVVFANARNNVPSYRVDSYVYMNGGGGTFGATPDVRLPTTGAVAVAVANLDGTGRKDLVFACQYNGTSFDVSTLAFLGGASGWSSTPDIGLPTIGATDVLVTHLVNVGEGGYLSKVIRPEDWQDTGTFHTLRYTASLGGQQAGTVRLVDALTWDVLAQTTLKAGTQEWVVKDSFWVKEHPSIRVMVTVSGLDRAGEFSLDDLWLNWTKRVRMSPSVVDLSVSPTQLLRLQKAVVWINATDEYDPARELHLVVEQRLEGLPAWSNRMLGTPTFTNGAWRVELLARADTTVGWYDLRVNVTDSDKYFSGYVVYPHAIEIKNNIPTAPEVRIAPAAPLTTTSLRVEVLMPALDVETGVTYRYTWFKDGALVEGLVLDTLDSGLTSRGENWSVEVRAFDGLDEGPPALAWALIHNAPPMVAQPLPYPEFPEDTVDDRWLDLGRSFTDPDGDALTFTVTDAPEHIQVSIDPTTGRVTLTPDNDWFGQEGATFVASDGQLSQSQTVLITVTPVNDAPWFTTLNGEPITTDPVEFEFLQGGSLVITVGAEDVEGDRLAFSVNTTSVVVDPTTGEMRYEPSSDFVGTLRFALTMWDEASQNVKVRLNITIAVLNVNDPPGEPRITNPRQGDKFKANTSLALIGACTDPDTQFGQVLNFTWFWNGTNLIGHGTNLMTRFLEPGNYTITLRVTDGEFSSESSVAIVVEPKDVTPPPPPPPPPDGDGDGDDGGLGMAAVIGIVVALVIIGGVVFLVMSRRRAVEETPAPVEEVDEQREALRRMAAAAKATADQMERELGESRAARERPPEPTPAEEIRVEGLGPPSKQTGLSVEARVTEQASKEVQALFEGVGATEAAATVEDQEALRIENLKHKYQMAISRLPYGIPAAALKGRDWPELASALATGEKKTLPDGREVTNIEGNWYFSDVKDASSFLTEHGDTPKPTPGKAAPAEAPQALDKETLLAKLEERLIMGEISEQTYQRLMKKYGVESEKDDGDRESEWEETS